MLSHFLRAVQKTSAVQVVGAASYGATASSTTHTINYPAGTQNGDLVICFWGTGLNGASITVTGFTTIFANAYSGATAGIYSKTVSGESSVTATFSSSTGTVGASLIVIRNGSYNFYAVAAPNNSAIDPISISANAGDIVATFGMAATSTAVTGIAESGYTVSSAQATAVRNMPFVVGYKSITTSGTEDPPAYTWSPSGVSDTAETLAFTVRFTPITPPTVKTVSYITSANTVAAQSSYTFSNISIGTAASDRYIVVAAFGSGGSSTTVTSVTVGGSNAASLVQIAGSTTVNSLFIIPVSTGTTANIVVTFPDAKDRCAVSVWRVTGISSITPYDTASFGTSNSVNTSSVNIDTVSGGILIASSIRGGTQSGTTTWTGATEAYDFTVSGRIVSGASLSNTSTETNRLLQTDFTTTAATAAFVAVSF
jgi:hypothetical protein